jgi:hypothetical protein
VAHGYNPNYTEGKDTGIMVLGQPGKKVSKTSHQQIKPDLVGHYRSLSYVGGNGRRTWVQGWPGKSKRPYLKKLNKAKRGKGFAWLKW